MFGLERHSGPSRLFENQCREVLIAMTCTDSRSDELRGSGGKRHRNSKVVRCGKTEIEVLAEQRHRERRSEVEIDERRRLVPAERGTHYRLVEELEKRRPAGSAALSEQGDLTQRLDHDAQE